MMSRLIAVLVCSLAVVSLAAGQSTSPSPSKEPVRLAPIVGPDTLDTEAIGHFRTRPVEPRAQPVNYLWDLGDGTLSTGGPLVSVVYSTPGTYTIRVVAQGQGGRDTLQTQVQVRLASERAVTPEVDEASIEAVSAPLASTVAASDEKPRRPRPIRVSREALYGSGGLAFDRGGYTWVLRSDLWAERAQSQMLPYRLQGYRADIYVDTTGQGSPAHRIVVGQFETSAEARAARAWLPGDGTGVWLLELPTPAKSAAAER